MVILCRLIGLVLGLWLMWFCPALGQMAKSRPKSRGAGNWPTAG